MTPTLARNIDNRIWLPQQQHQLPVNHFVNLIQRCSIVYFIILGVASSRFLNIIHRMDSEHKLSPKAKKRIKEVKRKARPGK